MMGNDVGLGFIGASPIEIAEWALESVHVFVLHVLRTLPKTLLH